MAYNAAQIDFGQAGGAFLNTTDAFTPPTGKVIVAISIITAETQFTLLTPSNDTGSNTYHIGTAVTANATGNGANAQVLTNSIAFPVGYLIRGRWSACTLRAGSALVYFAQE